MRDSYEDKYKDWKSKKERENARATAPKQTPNIYASKPVEQKPTFREQKQPTMIKEERIPQRMIIEEKKSSTYHLLIVLAFLVPLVILGYIIYLNYLPLESGESQSISITGGVINGNSADIYLADIKGEKIDSLKELYGSVFLIIYKDAIENNKTAVVSLKGSNVFIATSMPLNLNSNNSWDLMANFNKAIPSYFNGSVKYDSRRQCAFFMGNSSLYIPNTQNKYEKGPFVVYSVWTPINDQKESQQIIGHYNWELLQDKKEVRFQIGRVNAFNQTLDSLKGKIYTTHHPVTKEFFNKTHSALAVYMPSKKGYIELWIDGNLTERVPINDSTIWEDYNANKSLSLGKTSHGNSEYYDGCIQEIGFYSKSLIPLPQIVNVAIHKDRIVIPIVGNGTLQSINITVLE